MIFGLSVRVRQQQPRDAIHQAEFVEVDNQAQGNVQELHMAYDLGLVDGQNLLHGFDFEQETAFRQQAELQALFKGDVFVFDRHLMLPGGVNASEPEFVNQAFLIDAFQQTGSQRAMHFYRGSNDIPAKAICFLEAVVHGEIPV
jgi:hypothetical protein